MGAASFLLLVVFAALSTSSSFTLVPLAARSLATTSRLSSEPFPWESDVDKSEETLLKIHLAVQPGVDGASALAEVQRYTQSFPFAVVLPVQPLQYLPTHDGGVEVKFLRKKTEEKGTMDGGIRFYSELGEDGCSIELVAKRNSKGQTVSKIFSEKLVIQSFYDGISGKQDDRTGSAPTSFAAVQSVFHKWLV